MRNRSSRRRRVSRRRADPILLGFGLMLMILGAIAFTVTVAFFPKGILPEGQIEALELILGGTLTSVPLGLLMIGHALQGGR